MTIAPDHLRLFAIVALEEAVQECRYRKPRRSFAIRLALAYLWSLRPTEREPFDTFWRAIAADGMHRFSTADHAFTAIHRHLGLKRDEALFMRVWQRRYEEEKRC